MRMSRAPAFWVDEETAFVRDAEWMRWWDRRRGSDYARVLRRAHERWFLVGGGQETIDPSN
jgi:hypothetical protein